MERFIGSFTHATYVVLSYSPEKLFPCLILRLSLYCAFHVACRRSHLHIAFRIGVSSNEVFNPGTFFRHGLLIMDKRCGTTDGPLLHPYPHTSHYRRTAITRLLSVRVIANSSSVATNMRHSNSFSDQTSLNVQ